MPRLTHAWRVTSTDSVFLARYVLVGMGNVTLNFGVFWVLYHFFGVWYVLASLIGFLARFIFKFFALRIWVFGHRTRYAIARHVIGFSLLEAGGYLLGLPLLVFLVEWVHLPPPLGVIATISILYVFNMCMSRMVFRTKKAG